MNIPYFTLRILTLASYFLPFVFFLHTCDDGIFFKDAFNTDDAIQNETEKLEWKKENFKSKFTTENFKATKTDSLINDCADTYISSDNINNLSPDFYDKLIRPTPYSISGIGIILLYIDILIDKNALSIITIGISLILSFITFVFWFFIRKKKLGIYVISLNILSVLTFQVVCLVSHVEMLYGLWVLLFLLTMQLLTEIQSRKNTTVI
jgi:hypothetical protein